jgi:hypothetical protein
MTIATANVTTAAGNVYASSGNTVVTFLSLCNYTTSNVTANVWVVPSGGSVGNLTAAIANISIPAQDTYQFYVGNEKLILGNNDAIQANVSANNSVTVITSYTSA